MQKTFFILIFVALALGGFWYFSNKPIVRTQDISEPMAEFPCHQMGGQWMGTCVYDEDGNVVLDENGEPLNTTPHMMNDVSGETFGTQVKNLPTVSPTETVILKDGDTYEMTAGLVQQEVGNRVIKRLAYNKMIPGPILQVEKGSTITLRFKNELDVETTLHSHGLRGQDIYDGVPTDMGGKQVAMEPGDVFEYQLEFPDTGVFWYHPHIREDYGQELGLYGNFHVTEEDYWNTVDREEFLVLDDFSTDNPFYQDKTTQTLMGRFGNLFFINNQEDFNLDVQQGEIVRFYMTNTANTRTFDIRISGIDMKLVGGDIGRIEKEVIVENIIITPSERYIFEAQFSEPGTYKIDHRGKTMGTITVGEGAVKDTQANKTLRSNEVDYALIRDGIAELLEKPADKKLTIDIDMPGMRMGRMVGHADHVDNPTGDQGIEWEDEMLMMNMRTDDENVEWVLRDEETGKENMDIRWEFEKDDLVKIEIYNDPESMHPMQHPIHFHGQRFAVISRNGKPVDNLQWEDTTLIRTGERIELVLHTSNVGTWMTHCHIAEHLGAGMMFNFKVQ